MKRAIKAASSGEGWDTEYLYQVCEVLDEIYNLSYELRNCIRGAYTHCYTYEDLANYVGELGENLVRAADDLKEVAQDYDTEAVSSW